MKIKCERGGNRLESGIIIINVRKMRKGEGARAYIKDEGTG